MIKTAVPGKVGLLGATSFVGSCLLPLLSQAGRQTIAYSRQAAMRTDDQVEWRLAPSTMEALVALPPDEQNVPAWICVAPVWVLPEYFSLLETYGARRVVALSSTSRYTKDDSSDPEEQGMAHRLAEAEARVQVWAESQDIEWVILRPTLIYGLGRDKNITEIARFIRRFGFFPLFGKAEGLRQPIHVQDVADACMAALQMPAATNHAYNLSGNETLPYRDMVARIFAALGRQPRLLPVPLPAFRIAVALARHLPRYRNWSAAMAERMNQDLVFDRSEAARDLAFEPKSFMLSMEDLPI